MRVFNDLKEEIRICQKVEIYNESIVSEMLTAWESIKDSAIMTFMVNDTICQFHEDMEAISGKEILAKFLQAFLGASTYCKIEVNSGYGSGAVVVF